MFLDGLRQDEGKVESILTAALLQKSGLTASCRTSYVLFDEGSSDFLDLRPA